MVNRVWQTYRTVLFCRFFANYFALILIPVIVAAVLTNFFVVRLIERDAETLNNTIMQHFSEQTDDIFAALERDMVNMLSTVSVKNFLRTSGDRAELTQYYEWIHSLMQQMNKLDSGNLACKSFLYFTSEDLVIDGNTYNSKDEYFKEQYPIKETDTPSYFANFTDKKSMFFTGPHTVFERPPFTRDIISTHSNIAALMSYPFNSSNPDVYLAVNLDLDKLRERLGIQEKWVTDTMLVNTLGSVLITNGLSELQPDSFASMIRTQPEQTLFLNQNTKALSYTKSRFNDTWYYVSMIDLPTLMKPARTIRMITFALLGMFIVVGGLASYYLSRRLYNPIREIKTGLELQHQHLDGVPGLHGGNEFDTIKRFSHLLISKNKELIQTVNGMFPIVQEQFIARVLFGEYRDSLSIEYYAKEIAFPYNPVEAATVLCIEIQYYSAFVDQLSETSKSFMLAELKEKILKLSPAKIWVCQTRVDQLACVLHHEEDRDPKETTNVIKLLLEHPYYKASIGIGKMIHSVAALHQSYNHALSMLKYKSLNTGAEICSEQRVWKERASSDSFLSAHEVNRIFNRYKAGDYKNLLQSVFDLLDAGMRSNANAHQMKNLGTDVLNTWARAVESERNDFDISVYSEWFAAINRCVIWEEMRQTFRDIHGVLFRSIEPSDRKQQFAEILAYIRDHYNEELSIEYFAEQMNMSAGHFSRMFKEEVGEKYVEYIAKYRISKAKEFLLETDLKIDDIAEQIGYWGRNSFIRNFRRYEGITPAKYRAIHQS
ncbi:helix-turn-helix domain-containing protein [Paenibacillus sp.]|jgi:YesN/AraC family two-component response regulator|uniref:helix-turn-helix domain-containing protein n=1 Tax=Paenibacillus sp. TaxID=58172 RepID=UPI002827C8C9|nr:helix-turn-helix domain-containing protein [Paenibacillus sp.]MDR0267224.1 helix-turn-helix domain-containing protein [Paenibacillus sp.]